MFNFKTCEKPPCNTYICGEGPFCFRHSPNKEDLYKNCLASLLGDSDVIDLSITGAEFENLTLPKKGFVSSNMAWCTFRDIDFSACTFITSFFDFCLFENCRFNGINSRDRKSVV